MGFLPEMVADFCRRNECRYTPEQILRVMDNNLTIVDMDGFLTFNMVENELHILFCYAIPQNHYVCNQLLEAAYKIGRSNGCTRVQMITRRNERAMQRRLPDYKPAGIIFEKELV